MACGALLEEMLWGRSEVNFLTRSSEGIKSWQFPRCRLRVKEVEDNFGQASRLTRLQNLEFVRRRKGKSLRLVRCDDDAGDDGAK